MGVLRHLVVVVPGIGGSVLTAPDGRSAWDVTVRALTHVVIDPGVLDIDRELVATGVVDTPVSDPPDPAGDTGGPGE